MPSPTEPADALRLRHGPIAAARADGFKAVCLAGISLGGFMALNYAEQFPTELQGICLIAPPESVDVVPGAHDWLAWRKVWDHFLDRWPTLGWGA